LLKCGINGSIFYKNSENQKKETCGENGLNIQNYKKSKKTEELTDKKCIKKLPYFSRNEI